MALGLLAWWRQEGPMIKSFRLLGSAALLLTAMLVGDAHAAAKKSCRVLCKTELASCVTEAKAQNDCTGLKGKAKRDCRHAQRMEAKSCKQGVVSQCHGSTSTTTCS
jgi:hypothetical protein